MTDRIALTDLPMYAIIRQDDAEGVPFLGLMVTTHATTHQFYLCGKDNFRQVAQQIHDQIIKAGQDMLRQDSKLVKPKLIAVQGSFPKDGNGDRKA